MTKIEEKVQEMLYSAISGTDNTELAHQICQVVEKHEREKIINWLEKRRILVLDFDNDTVMQAVPDYAWGALKGD